MDFDHCLFRCIIKGKELNYSADWEKYKLVCHVVHNDSL